MTETERTFLDNIDYGYVDQTVRNIRSSLNITAPQQPVQPGPLLSIHLQSNRPDNFARFCEELEQSLDDSSRVEVVIKIDDTDSAMNELLPQLVDKHSFTLKYISTPLVGGFFELWRSMNDMLKVCHPHAYFLWNMNDEMAVLNKGWDTMLAKYVGLFPDHIFRLRTSLFRFRNYYDFWECGFAPETSAITTKKWMDICGDWNPCLGPDTFNQCVAFYLGYHDRFNKHRPLRDVPIHDIVLAGEGAFIGLEGDTLWKRMRGATKAWYRLMSYEVQTEASRRSQKLLAHIWASDERLHDFTIEENRLLKNIVVYDEAKKPLKTFSYGLSLMRIELTNFYRATHYYYYGGGGNISRSERFRQVIAFLALRFDVLAWIRKAKKTWPHIRSWLKRHILSVAVIKNAVRKLKLRLRARFHESVYAFDNIQDTMDWEYVRKILAKAVWPEHLSKQNAQFTLLKCLLLQRWYNLSDNELQVTLGRDLAFRRFANIPLNAPPPATVLIERFHTLLQVATIEKILYEHADSALEQNGLPENPIMQTARAKAA